MDEGTSHGTRVSTAETLAHVLTYMPDKGRQQNDFEFLYVARSAILRVLAIAGIALGTAGVVKLLQFMGSI